MIDVGWAERYTTMKKQIMPVTAPVGWAYYWSQIRYLSWQVVTELIGLTVCMQDARQNLVNNNF